MRSSYFIDPHSSSVWSCITRSEFVARAEKVTVIADNELEFSRA